MTSIVGLTELLNVTIADGTTPIINSAGANGVLLSVNTLGFNSISVQITGVWEAEITCQASNDNINWVNIQGYAFNSAMSAVDTIVDNDIYIFPVVGAYFQAVVSGYLNGPINATAYLRSQSLAGIGEAALTQAMDSSNGTPINTTFQGIQGPGQQPAANSMPVALANEQVLDKWIVGKQYQTAVPVNTNLLLTVDQVANNPAQPTDCLQYRSISLQVSQSASVTAGAITFEASNDGVNWTSYPLYLATANVYGGQSTTRSMSTTVSSITYHEGPLYMRFFRVRMSTAMASTATTVQAWARLSMAPYTKYNQSAINIDQVGTGAIPSSIAPNSTTASTGFALANPMLVIGGNDRSVVRPEVLGAPTSTLTPYISGPYARNMYTDISGNIGVAGPNPAYAEDKTYPVNVRLERTTNGQDSVQDLLQQVLVELKAMSYYIRELPITISSMNQTPNPAVFGNPFGMADDPENFFNDPTTFRYMKGN